MKLKAITVWLFLFAGVLYATAGLRDIFAPGFLKVSPGLPSKTDIAVQFLLAGTFLGSGLLINISKKQTPTTKN